MVLCHRQFKMIITVRSSDGSREALFLVRKTTPVSELKMKVKDQMVNDKGLQDQRLFFGGKQMENRFTLSHYGVNSNNVVQLMVQTPLSPISMTSGKDDVNNMSSENKTGKKFSCVEVHKSLKPGECPFVTSENVSAMRRRRLAKNPLQKTLINYPTCTDLKHLIIFFSISRFIRRVTFPPITVMCSLQDLNVRDLTMIVTLEVLHELYKSGILECPVQEEQYSLHSQYHHIVRAALRGIQNRAELVSVLYSGDIYNDDMRTALEKLLPKDLTIPGWMSEIPEEVPTFQMAASLGLSSYQFDHLMHAACSFFSEQDHCRKDNVLAPLVQLPTGPACFSKHHQQVKTYIHRRRLSYRFINKKVKKGPTCADLKSLITFFSISRFIKRMTFPANSMMSFLRKVNVIGLTKSDALQVLRTLRRTKVLEVPAHLGQNSLHTQFHHIVRAALMGIQDRAKIVSVLYSGRIYHNNMRALLENLLPEDLTIPEWMSGIPESVPNLKMALSLGLSKKQYDQLMHAAYPLLPPKQNHCRKDNIPSSVEELAVGVASLSKHNHQNSVNPSDIGLDNQSVELSPNVKRIKFEPLELAVGVKTEIISVEEYYPDFPIPNIPGLKDAVERECWEECENLLKKNIGLNTPELKQLQYAKEYENVLETAVSKGFTDLIKLFLHNKFPVNKVIHDSCLLIYSLKYYKVGMFNLLLEAGADVNIRGSNGETPLHICAKEGYFKTVKLLVSKGANVTELDENKNGILHLAAKNNHCEIVKLLLDKGANVNLKGPDDCTPLHISTENGYYNLVKLLFDRGGANLDLKDINGNTPLHISIMKGYDNISILLYESGANINARNNMKETPLILAAKHGHAMIVKRLLGDIYCDKDAKDLQYSKTALDWARSQQFTNIVNIFLAAE